MAWSYVGVARIEQNWGRWQALVTLALDVPPTTESTFREFASQPTPQQAADAGAELVVSKNADGASFELADAVVRDVVPAMVFQNKTQLAALFRAKYITASAQDAARMATWIINRITAGDFTDAQVQAAFGLTSAQYTAMKTRMTNLRTQWLAVLAAAGE